MNLHVSGRTDNSRPIKVHIRFYGSLNDFLPGERQGRSVETIVKGHPAVKDSLEASGVPHTEMGAIYVNKRSVPFSHQLKEGDKIAVYPAVYPRQLSGKVLLRDPFPLKKKRFVLDSHLGKLVRHLRLLGFDCFYKKIFPDKEIIKQGLQDRRIVLTRDIGLLKNRDVQYGYWVRSPYPPQQLKEVLVRYHLSGQIRPFTLCLECNGKVRRISKIKIRDQLPPKVAVYYSKFYQCQGCSKIYWQGSHYAKLEKIVRKSLSIR